MIGHLAVILLDRDEKTDEDLIIEPFEAEKVDEHEKGFTNFVIVIHVQCVKGEPGDGFEDAMQQTIKKWLIELCKKKRPQKDIWI